MAVLQTWCLTNTTDGHNKFYEVVIEQNTRGTYDLKARYGAIGRGGSWAKKGTFAKRDGWNGANGAAIKLIDSKTDRGYKLSDKSTIPAPAIGKNSKPEPINTALNRFGSLE